MQLLSNWRLGLVWNGHLRAKRPAGKVPDGLRVYAIGDVHGRADLLEALFARIDADNAAHHTPRSIEIFLGDYIDRGPSSREVLDLLIARRRGGRLVCLKGNHETYVDEFLRNPPALADWKTVGGLNTLLSYGITPSMNSDDREQQELADAFGRTLPDQHRQFLNGLALSYTCGDYFFVHAGVRPCSSLRNQLQQDLLGIREDFLLHEEDFGKIVVHGHTPVMQPDIRSNRINIDTGAYATGRLTCLRLEGDGVEFV
jgi:serine/threonine protein phosphatase 1